MPVSAPDETRAGTPTRLRRSSAVVGVPLVVVATVLAGLALGRYSIAPDTVVRILAATVLPITPDWSAAQAAAVLDVRLPRVLLGLLVGAGLALSGAVLQAVFRNPIVNAQIIGVSPGASFGGALAIVLGLGSGWLVGGAFVFGMAALLLVFVVSRAKEGARTLTIVLAGVVVGAFFSALVSLVTYFADPYNDLQAIVFWLLGSLATATPEKVATVAVPVLAGSAVILALRWRVNVLSLGDDDAAALGVKPGPLRWALLTAVGAMVAGAVAVSGVIGWVGLVVPHLTRLWVGPDHRILLPVTVALGGAYLTAVDTVTRTFAPGEIPIGVLTAVIGAPLFLLLLHRSRRRGWADE
ncbi:MAG: ABC transporter permease [Pseudonocardia sp. SCN 72-86]|nr:MAG: ABC transporter permease [Pseudonocardia sp. SCN 72-86]